MIVRELITKLGFKVDTAKLAAFDRSIGDAKAKMQGLTQNIQGAAQGMRNFGILMTAAVTLPITLLGIRSLKTASDLEQMDVAFTTMLGSAEAAKKLIKELLEFTAKTPFQLTEVQQNAKLLLGMGIASEKIIPTLTALGNVAAGLSVPLERIAMNYGQVRTQTILTGAELRDFARAGVPLIGELAKMLNKSEAEIKKMVSSGEIGFDKVEKAFMNMSGEGGKFFDLMQKQSKTLGGRWSNLMDVITLTSAEFGKMIEETFNLKENMVRLTIAIENLMTKFKTMSPFWRKVVVMMVALTAIIPVLIALISSLALAVFAVTSAWATLGPIITAIAAVGAAGLAVILAKVLLVIAAVVAIAAVLWLAYDDLKTWVQGGDSLIGRLLGSFQNFWARVTFLWSLLTKTISALWEALTTGSEGAWSTFKALFGQIVGYIGNLVEMAMDRIWELIPRLIVIMGKLEMMILEILAKIVVAIVKTTFNIIKNAIMFAIRELDSILTGWATTAGNKVNAWFADKFPALNGLLTTEPGGNSSGAMPKTTIPSAALATSGTAFGPQEFNVNSKVNLTVPEGTPEQQEKYLQTAADAVFDRKLNDMLVGAINANRQVEE